MLAGALCLSLLAASSLTAKADAQGSGVRPIGEKPPEPPKVEAGSAITMPGDKPPRPPRLEPRLPVELVPSLSLLRAFTSALPLGWLLDSNLEPLGIVAPGERPPKGPR
jgi:hypothetical protein